MKTYLKILTVFIAVLMLAGCVGTGVQYVTVTARIAEVDSETSQVLLEPVADDQALSGEYWVDCAACTVIGIDGTAADLAALKVNDVVRAVLPITALDEDTAVISAVSVSVVQSTVHLAEPDAAEIARRYIEALLHGDYDGMLALRADGGEPEGEREQFAEPVYSSLSIDSVEQAQDEAAVHITALGLPGEDGAAEVTQMVMLLARSESGWQVVSFLNADSEQEPEPVPGEVVTDPGSEAQQPPEKGGTVPETQPTEPDGDGTGDPTLLEQTDQTA